VKWSEIFKTSSKVKDADLPWPLVVAVQRSKPDDPQRKVDMGDPIFEFSLTEFGSWSLGYNKTSQGAFTPIRYLGTEMSKGKPKDPQMCWEGFDRAR
jgi:lysophospholipase